MNNISNIDSISQQYNPYLNKIVSSIGFSLDNPWTQVFSLLVLVIIALLIDLYVTKIILKAVEKFTKKSKVKWDDILFQRNNVLHLCHLIAPFLIYLIITITITQKHWAATLLTKISLVYIIISIALFINSFLTSIYEVIHNRPIFKDKPLKGILQIFIIIVWIIATIIIISILAEESPAKLLATLGASAAIILLIFKDTITGLVSGVQLAGNDMVAVGDWISVPQHNADGVVIEITLHTIKVQNWDNTISTVPPSALVNGSFQNWKGMTSSGGRRVKRSINIDMNSVKFCNKEDLEKYEKYDLLKNYIEEKEKELKIYNENKKRDTSIKGNGRRQTNLGIFRAYLTEYLKNSTIVNHNLTWMVRQLQPTEKGLPIEVYFFSKNKDWVKYEGIQADLFDHILAIIPEFDLNVYQEVSGKDLKDLISKK